MQLQLGGPVKASSFRGLLDAMPDKEFRRITRSTLALLAWWRDSDRVGRFVSALGLPLGAASIAHFEYPVKSGCETCKGRGKSSFTDVMLDLGDSVVAIEAKRTEALYETVKTWLTRDTTENRQRVLSHWIRCCLGLDGPLSDYEGLVYQMVHRAASARAAAGTRPSRVVHLIFGDDHVNQYVDAVSMADRLLSRQGVDQRFLVVTVSTRLGPTHDRLVAATDSADGADLARETLAEVDSIFDFGDPEVAYATGGVGQR